MCLYEKTDSSHSQLSMEPAADNDAWAARPCFAYIHVAILSAHESCFFQRHALTRYKIRGVPVNSVVVLPVLL